MQMQYRWNVALAVIMLAVVSQAAAQPTPRMRGAKSVPREIHDFQIDRFAIWLNLSPEQEHAVRLLLEQYTEQWLETLPEERQALIELYDEYQKENNNAGINFNQAEIMTKLLRHAEVLRSAMADHDELFFQRIESMLTDEQKQHMDRVRLWRKRTTLVPDSAMLAIRPESGKVDLMEYIRIETHRPRRRFSAGEPEYITLTQAEYERLLPAVNEYEPMLVAAFGNFAEAERRNLIPLYYDRIDQYLWLRNSGRTEMTDPEGYAEVARLEQLLLRRLHPHAMELARVNRWGLEIFKQHLPAEKAAELERIYMEIAFPRVFPDHSSAEPLYDAALEIETLDEDQHQGILALRARYRDRHTALSGRMREARRGLTEASSRGDRPWFEAQYEFQLQIHDLGWQREALNAAQKVLLEVILTPEQVEELPEWDFEKSPPRRPWYDRRIAILEERDGLRP